MKYIFLWSTFKVKKNKKTSDIKSRFKYVGKFSFKAILESLPDDAYFSKLCVNIALYAVMFPNWY